jgi:hypothetical protein
MLHRKIQEIFGFIAPKDFNIIWMFVSFPYFHKTAAMFKNSQVDCLALKKLQITHSLLK